MREPHPVHDHAGAAALQAGSAHLAKDPVCGMDVDPHTAKHRADHSGRTYYFCSARCRERFVADPAKFLAPEATTPETVPEGTIYTCPMHPEIRQVGPGSCPICGMALEPVTVTAETGPNPELVDMTRRFWIGVVLAVPVVALEMGGHLTNLHMLLGQQLSNWLQLAARHAGGALGRLAVLRAGLELDRHPEPQHVHADRARHRGRLALQRGGDGGAGHISRGLPRHGRLGCGLFRGGRGHHGSRPARPGARAPRPRADLGGDPRATRSRPQDRAADQARRLGRRSDPRPDRHRRPPAGPAGREGAGRWLSHRRPVGH